MWRILRARRRSIESEGQQTSQYDTPHSVPSVLSVAISE